MTSFGASKPMVEFWPRTGVPPLQHRTTKPALCAIKQMPICISGVSRATRDSVSVPGEIMT